MYSYPKLNIISGKDLNAFEVKRASIAFKIIKSDAVFGLHSKVTEVGP